MRLSIAAVAACVGAAQAFIDTSPFLLFSSSPLPKDLSNVETAQIQSSSSILSATTSFLAGCPSELYYIITQPSLSSSDLSSPDSVPYLKKALTNPGVHSRYSVSEVVGLKDVTVEDVVREIKSQCDGMEVLGFGNVEKGNESWKERVMEGETVILMTWLEQLPGSEEERRVVLADNDAKLHGPLADLSQGYKYTVIYLTTPPLSPIQPSTSEQVTYEPEFQNLEHLDLKRNLKIREDNTSLNATDLLPLFEKYQFVTPGLFMGLFVAVILISILGVGLSAIGSLQVSYGAFDKEMGPAAQKK